MSGEMRGDGHCPACGSSHCSRGACADCDWMLGDDPDDGDTSVTLMNGPDLYARWIAANAEHDCGVTPWEELDEFDHACWNTFADLIDAPFRGEEDDHE